MVVPFLVCLCGQVSISDQVDDRKPQLTGKLIPPIRLTEDEGMTVHFSHEILDDPCFAVDRKDRQAPYRRILIACQHGAFGLPSIRGFEEFVLSLLRTVCVQGYKYLCQPVKG